MPPCPLCKSKKVIKSGDRNFFCTRCKATFDDASDEGGDYFTDPTRRAELVDEAEQRRKRKLRGFK